MERATPIVSGAGRERELAAMLNERALVSGGAARRVIVSGPSGIGKSWLLDAASRAFSTQGVPVARARAGRGAVAALSLVRDLSSSLLEIARVVCAPAAFDDLCARLRILLDPAAAERDGGPEERRTARILQIEALARLFAVAGTRRAVVVIDEVDSADPGSRDLLAAVVAGLSMPGAGVGLLFVVSWREPPAGELVACLEALPGVDVGLGSLDVEGVRSFLEESRLAERLLERTEGIPSRLEEMLVPRPTDFVLRRIARLERSPRRCALASALLGRPAPASLLLEAAGPGATQAHLDDLVEDRFLSLRLSSGQPVYDLAREDDRSRLLDGATFEERRDLHVAIASRLEASGADVEEIARHWVAGEPEGRGAAWALRAAEELAARCAYDAAAEFLREALAWRAARPEVVHLRLAEVLEAAGDAIGALRHLGLARRGATPEEARSIRAGSARLCVAIGKIPQALRLSEKVLGGERLPRPGDDAGAAAFAAACDARFLAGRYQETIADCREGLERLASDSLTRILLRNTLGKALLTFGVYDEAERAFGGNVEEADAAGLTREQTRAIVNEGVVAHRTGDRRRAFERYRHARSTATDPLLAAAAAGNLAALHHEVGEFDEAIGLYVQAIGAFVRAGRRKEASHHSLNFARLAQFLGDLDAAADRAAFSRREASLIGDPYLVAQADMVSGDVLRERGEPYRAEAVVVVAQETFEALGHARYLAEATVVLARIYLARGEKEAAREELRRARSVANPSSEALSVELELVEAELALADGELPIARTLLEQIRSRLLEHEEGIGGASDLHASWRTHALLSRLRDAEGDQGGAEAERLRALRLIEDQAARVPEDLRARFLAQSTRSLGAAREVELTPALAGRVRRMDGEAPADRMVGKSPALRRLRLSLGPIARSLAPVLIRGEAGTGRKLLADAIHQASPLRDRPFVAVLASVEESLFPELFGVDDRPGALERAAGGTVFLEDLGALSASGQLALARLLGRKEYRRIGRDEILRSGARIVVSTASDLEEMLASRALRRELYDELEAVTLELPPLRDRIEDVPALVAHFLERLRTERGEAPRRFSDEALETLMAWTWPGNVRELEKVVGAVSIFAEGAEVDREAFERFGRFPPPYVEPPPPAVFDESPVVELRPAIAEVAMGRAAAASLDYYALAKERGLGLRELRDEVEHQMIASALNEAKGNISEAARLLQMKRSRLSQIVNAEPRLRPLARSAS